MKRRPSDPAHKATDDILEQLEGKVSKEYEKAAREASVKLQKHLSAFEAKDNAKRADLAKGLITEKEYKNWRVGQMMMGKRWEEMSDTLAQDFHNANRISRSIVNGYMPEVYALNHNYGTFEVEKGALVDTSYTLYDRQTVERLLRDEPDLLMPPGKQLEKTFGEFDAYKSGKPVMISPKKEAAFKKLIKENKDVRWQRGKIQSVTLQSILQGESIPNMAKRIAREMGEINRSATVRYARTATTAAENAGRIDSYKRAEDLGIEMEQEWMATIDMRTRPSHIAMDGERVAVGETFSNGCKYPADPDGAPEEVYNCRCTLRAVVKNHDYSKDGRFKRLPEDMTYEDWKKRAKSREDNEPESQKTSVFDLERPKRPRQSDFGGYTDEFVEARNEYKEKLSEYNNAIDEAVKASAEDTAFKDFDGLKEWAKANDLSVEQEVFDSIDIRSFNEAKPALEEMFNRFPEVKSYQFEGYDGEKITTGFRIGVTDDGMLSANGGLNFNPRLFGDYENGLRSALESVTDGTLVRGDGTFKTLVRHEYGHNVQNYIEFKMRDKYHMGVDDWRKNYPSLDAYKKAQSDYSEERKRYEKELLSLAGLNGSSDYSNTNTLELFAEGFAEYSSGGKSEFGVEFGKFLKRWY